MEGIDHGPDDCRRPAGRGGDLRRGCGLPDPAGRCLLRRARARNVVFLLAIATLAGAAWITSAVAVPSGRCILCGHYVADPMGTVLKLFAYGAAAVTLLYSRDYLARRELLQGEYLVLALFAVLGIQVIVSAGSLLSLYLGIEIMSLSLYAMVAFDREDGIAAEAAMKYFVLGAIASGSLLYGISILYGVTGSFLLDGIAAAVGAGTRRPSGCCSASRSSSSASRSSSAPCRSTCGCRTSITARRPR